MASPSNTASPADLDFVSSLAPEGTTTFLSGSLAAGLGHANSDIDIHVIGAAPARVDRLVAPRGRRVQFTSTTEDSVAIARKLATTFETSNTDRALLYLQPRDLWDLWRLASSLAIHIENADADLFSDRFRLHVARVLMSTNAHQAARAADDALGMLAAGHQAVALDTARSALRHACEMLLAGSGDLYAAPKFLLLRLERLALPQGRRAQGILLGEDRATPDEVIALARSLSIWSQVFAWDGRADLTSRLPTDREPHIRQKSDVWPLRFSDGTWLLIKPPDVGRVVGGKLATLWCCSSYADVKEALRDAGVDATDEEVVSGLRRLASLGYLEASGGDDMEKELEWDAAEVETNGADPT